MDRKPVAFLRHPDALLFVLMLIFVPLAGELNFFPFPVNFRVSLATPVFFFYLLMIGKVHPLLSGLSAGLSVASFRVGKEVWFSRDIDWMTAIHHHYPAFFYYVAYAVLFAVFGIRRFHTRPLLIGSLAVGMEFGASLTELAFRHELAAVLSSFVLSAEIAILAVIRSFFVLGFYNIILLYQAKWSEEQQRKQTERMLLLISNLYKDSVHLKKTLTNAEMITKECYDLYRELKKPNSEPPVDVWASRMLRIAGQVHDMKKDNQRIYAGLSKLISDESFKDYMSLNELGSLMVRANNQYAEILGKAVHIRFHSEESTRVHVYSVLSILNNLVANAIEAIRTTGTVTITAEREQDQIVLRVEDNGPGIQTKNVDVIFDPGFTTKFDFSGRPSTGIGLSYVKELVGEFGGSIAVEPASGQTGTVFTVRLPADRLVWKE